MYNNNYDLEKWYPFSDLCSMYEIRSIRDLVDGFFVELVPDSISESENKKYDTIILNWPGSIVSYMDTDARYRDLINLDENNNRWTFFKVKNSKYIELIKMESENLIDEDVEHYCILGTNTVLDVLVSYEPNVMDNKKKYHKVHYL